MSAIQFVKDFGIDHARDAVANIPESWDSCYLRVSNFELLKHMPSIDDWVCMNELKKIVDAFEYIEKFGGLDKAKILRSAACFLTIEECKYHNECIKKVEQCNG